jgi:hypothetical protein
MDTKIRHNRLSAKAIKLSERERGRARTSMNWSRARC